ncbi:MAG: bifunctional alpha,alpha-trehalose-phosphate synthase (UDP-forming)/trehalose-phosphatase [Flavobacteriales bacterium]
MKKSRLLIVSNRLPFRITEKKGELVFSQSSGGLVSSTISYVQKTNHAKFSAEVERPLWIGTSDISEMKFNEKFPSGSIIHKEFEIAPVFIPTDTQNKFYNGFCNDTIWPLFHYFPSYAKFSDECFTAFEEANHLFCKKILQLYRPHDIIWIHDYHLMLLPALLRKYLPNATIGFFLHIPFPSYELFRLLPSVWRKSVLKGILGADLIGLHTNDYVQHFLKSTRQILDYDHSLRLIITPERSVTVDTFPISIDYNKFNACSLDSNTFNERNKIKKKLYDLHVIISVDRLDYAKGLLNKLESFELFLNRFPQYQRKVVFILLVVPSRDIITKYSETKKEIEGLVSSINGKYGSVDWTPIVYQYKSLDFKNLVALYLSADVALITPVRDGMNLVSKEFIASRTDKKGVLILSETAGAASELGEAILVNPTDRKEIADSIHLALTMPVNEQVARNEVMQNRIKSYDVMKWAEDFITQLIQQKNMQKKLNVKEITPLIEIDLQQKYCVSRKRLFLLDYDGTLSPLAKLPHLAAPNEDILNLLLMLSSDIRNEVVVISGRGMEVLEKWFANIPISLVAEHGAFIKHFGESWKQTIPVKVEWKEAVQSIFNLYTERCAGTFTEEKTLSLAWHYRNAEAELGFLRSRELINSLMELSTHLDFQIIEGNKVIEVRARGIDKGMAANLWLNNNSYDFIMAVGDDKTDEDMFKVIPANQYSIKVGLMQSDAKYNLKQQKNVIELLLKLLMYEELV